MIIARCPVCNGVGFVSGGFYSSSGDVPHWDAAGTGTETCRSCGGKGYIYLTLKIKQETVRGSMPKDLTLENWMQPSGYFIKGKGGTKLVLSALPRRKRLAFFLETLTTIIPVAYCVSEDAEWQLTQFLDSIEETQ